MAHELLAPPGIRAVRVLARERHTERLLVHLQEGDGSSPAEVVRSVDEAGARRIRRAIAALDRLHGTGVGGLLDVFDDRGAPAILLANERGPSLSQVLLTRMRWQAGEAVGVLAPLADAIERMHDVGVAHGGLDADCVRLTSTGAVVSGFGSAELFPAGAPEVVRERIDAVARDREALRGIAVAVLARVDGSRAVAAGDLLRRVGELGAPEVARCLSIELAQLAAPMPMSAMGPEDDQPVDLSGAGDHAPEVTRAEGTTADEVAGTALERLFAGMNGEALVDAARAQFDRLRSLLRSLPSGRRRLVIAGGGAIAIAAVLLSVIPPQDRGEPATDTSTREPAVEAEESVHPAPAPEADAPGAHDDPGQALVALLVRREDCFRELSMLCLDQVDQLGSAALASDRAALLAMRDGSEGAAPSVEPIAPRIVERLGDSALIEIGPETAPASLLVMRSEAGWRIRDWIAGG